MKKLVSVLLTMVMVLAMTATVFADETGYTITINNEATGHIYEAYQIFSGDLSGDTANKVLSNIVWGSGITADGQTTLQNIYAPADNKSAAGVAAALDENNAKQFAKDAAGYLTETKVESTYNEENKNYTISGLTAGYYLVKDQDGSLTGDNDSYTEYMVKVVGDTTATPKSDVPTVQKKVKDINNSTETAMTEWQDSADHDIDDSVPFQLKATLANNVSSYTTYKVVFHDTLSKGLTYNNDAVVKIGDKDVTESFTITTTSNDDGTTLTVSCNDVKALGAGNSSVITVEYTATLNENAVLGSAGNPNKVYLEYSNNPNKSESGNNETGNTPEDVVIVFTYKTIINKVDKDGNALPGAEFTLEKYNKETGKWEAITVVENDKGTTFIFSGLDDGNYRLTETKTPAGYNTIAPIEFTVMAEHDVLSDNPALKSLSGEATTGELTFTPSITEGSLSANVVNQAGNTLPETGGMGTTIFYVLGSILVLGAAVLLITRKRMGAQR